MSANKVGGNYLWLLTQSQERSLAGEHTRRPTGTALIPAVRTGPVSSKRRFIIYATIFGEKGTFSRNTHVYAYGRF